MKFSKKLVFLAIILIVVSIITMYFGAVKLENMTCPTGQSVITSITSDGTNVECSGTATTTTTSPTTTTTTTPTTVSAYYKTGSPACSVSGTGFIATAPCGGSVTPQPNNCKSYNTTQKKWYNPDTKAYINGPASTSNGSGKFICP